MTNTMDPVTTTNAIDQRELANQLLVQAKADGASWWTRTGCSTSRPRRCSKRRSRPRWTSTWDRRSIRPRAATAGIPAGHPRDREPPRRERRQAGSQLHGERVLRRRAQFRAWACREHERVAGADQGSGRKRLIPRCWLLRNTHLTAKVHPNNGISWWGRAMGSLTETIGTATARWPQSLASRGTWRWPRRCHDGG